MDIRNSEEFRNLFVADPQILGVDAVKGSEVIFPVVFKTQATKQYGPIREFRRRVRIALEENALLPGDPNRIFREFAGKPGTLTEASPQLEQGAAAKGPAEKPAVDPTTIPAITHDPFIASS